MPVAPEPLSDALADRYRFTRELGRGGMARVYLAHDLKHDREVAVKVLEPDVARTLGTFRFLREIEIAARLSHPHILALHDSGEAAEHLFYVMPYVEGGTLQQRITEQPQLPVEEVIRTIGYLADALEYAHKNGVVHRDVKPANVLLAGRHCLLADFGVAKALSDVFMGQTNPTSVGPIGTPAYMAPEQAAADPRIDHRADIYALGAVAYHMLAGRPPFIGKEPHQVVQAQVMEPVPPLSTFRRGLPRGLVKLVEKCLEKDPNDRWQHAGDLLSALSAFSAPGPLPFAPSAARHSTGRRMIGAVAAIAVTVGVAVAVRDRAEPPLPSERVVVGTFVNETGDADLDDLGSFAAHWITQDLQRTNLFDVIPTASTVPAEAQIRERVAEGRITDPIRALADETGAGTVVSGAFHRERARLQFHVEITDAVRGQLIGGFESEADESQPWSDMIDQLRDRVTGQLAVAFDERLPSSTGSMGQPPTYESYRAFKQGLEAYTRNQYGVALPHFERAFDLDSTFALPLLYASLSCNNLGCWGRADSLVRILDGFRDALGPYDLRWLEYQEARVRGDSRDALRAVREASEIAPGSKADYNRAVMALRTNRPQEAIDALERVHPDRGAMRGWLPYWNHETWALHELGRYDEEIASARRARTRFPEHIRTIQLEAEALVGSGRFAEIDSLLDLAETMAARGTRNPGWVIMSVARETRAHEYPDDARRLFDRALAWFEAQPDGFLQNLTHRHQYGVTLYNAGRFDDAERWYDRFNGEVPDHAGAMLYLGLLAAHRGDTEEARRWSASLAAADTPYSFGARVWDRAQIAAALGEVESAITLLRQSLTMGRGVRRFRPHGDPDFDSLMNIQEFADLFRPRG